MPRLAPIALAMIVLMGPGCADRPDRTPTVEPVEFLEPTDDETIPPPNSTGPVPKRIEMH